MWVCGIISTDRRGCGERAQGTLVGPAVRPVADVSKQKRGERVFVEAAR